MKRMARVYSQGKETDLYCCGMRSMHIFCLCDFVTGGILTRKQILNDENLSKNILASLFLLKKICRRKYLCMFILMARKALKSFVMRMTISENFFLENRSLLARMTGWSWRHAGLNTEYLVSFSDLAK